MLSGKGKTQMDKMTEHVSPLELDGNNSPHASENAPTPLEFLTAVYCNENLPLHHRMKAAIEAAQYCHPRLSMTATITEAGFAEALDRAMARSGKLIEHVRPDGEGSKPAPEQTIHASPHPPVRPFVPRRR